jgi:hypothetical protein
MQLLLHPSTTPGLTGNFRYKLWVKFEVTPEERSLITKYAVNRTILWRGRTLRDFVRAVLWGTLPALIISAVIVADLERNTWPGLPIVIPIVVWSALIYLIYHQIREEVRVSDVLVGRFFKSPSVISLYERERMITKAAMVFERLLERLTTWEQPEIITLEPQRLPIRRVLEVTPLVEAVLIFSERTRRRAARSGSFLTYGAGSCAFPDRARQNAKPSSPAS